MKDTLAISPAGYFYIHYDTTGSSAPDADDQNDNGVPDYVDEVGSIADSARYVLVDILGYQTPVPDCDDSITDPISSDHCSHFGGNSLYDIYIMSYAAGMYGFNYHEGGGKSYLRIDNDYIGYNSIFDLSPIKIMQITVGHEYFHGIQWGYRFSLANNAYFYEMSSMWFEDVLIPDGNDYLDGWADPLLDNPMASFDNTGNGYELALFGHYLSSFLDPNGFENIHNSTIIREMWERFDNTSANAFSAIQDILNGENYNLTFIEAWVDFISRNLYNGNYSNMDNPFYYYVDQALIAPISTYTTSLNEDITFQLELDNKSVAIKSFTMDELNAIIEITHSNNDYLGRMIMLAAEQGYNNLFWSNDTLVLNTGNNVHFIYGTDSQSSTLNITVNIYPSIQIGDINGDSEFNVLDIVALVNCVLAANCPDIDNGYGYAGDMNSDGIWNIIDIVALANCVLASNCGD